MLETFIGKTFVANIDDEHSAQFLYRVLSLHTAFDENKEYFEILTLLLNKVEQWEASDVEYFITKEIDVEVFPTFVGYKQGP